MPEPNDDRTALAAMLMRHRPRLRRTLRRLGVAEPNLDDALQDVFVVLVRRIDEYDADRDDGGIEAWLRGIARRIASNHRRSDVRARRLRAELAVAPMESAPEGAIGSGAADILHAFLEGLPPEQCEVFVLGEVHGLTGPEIAARLGIKLDTAYSRLRAARRELQRTVARIRVRDGRGSRTAAFALLPRFVMGVAAMKIAVALPAVLVLASVVVAGAQLGAQRRPAAADVVGGSECVLAEPTSPPQWNDACVARRDHCRERVDACRRELSSCEQQYVERMPLPMKFEDEPASTASELRITPLIERVAEASGSELSVECRGDVCRIMSTTTDEVLASRPVERAPGNLLQRDPAYASEAIGGSFASDIPSTDLQTGEGIWLEEIWVLLRAAPEGDAR